MKDEELFIPTTRAIGIGGGVFYRPVRSWNSGVFAGEGITEHHGDRSGCLELIGDRRMMNVPFTVTHRYYWHEENPKSFISAFLSYPGGMGFCDEYFWEVYIGGDVKRFIGPQAEEQCEEAIRDDFLKEERFPGQALR